MMKTAAATLGLPLTMSIRHIAEDMHDVPQTANEDKIPVFFRIRKKTAVIKIKKMTDMVNRNFAKVLVNGSLSLYLLNSFELIVFRKVIDNSPRFKCRFI